METLYLLMLGDNNKLEIISNYGVYLSEQTAIERAQKEFSGWNEDDWGDLSFIVQPIKINDYIPFPYLDTKNQEGCVFMNMPIYSEGRVEYTRIKDGKEINSYKYEEDY